MSNNMLGNNIKHVILGILIGCIITVVSYSALTPIENEQVKNIKRVEKKPIYWVAPMDANYRKNKPGKSPMGMDLVPVYDNSAKGVDEGIGTIRISPNVINNLGVRTTLARYKRLHTQINTVGYVTYDEDKLVHIHPRVQGWIEKLHVKAIGDPVKKGQPLYEIYSP